jgi:hypothetical protein
MTQMTHTLQKLRVENFTDDLKRLFKPLNTIERFLLASWLIIITLMPFHAFISTWGGTVFGHLLIWKSWKDILLLFDLFVAFAYLLQKKRFHLFYKNKVFWLIMAYSFLNLILWVALRPDKKAAIAALLINLRLFGILLLGWVLMTFVDLQRLLKVLLPVLLVGAVIVIVFGLMQITVLPKDFLAHFGYGPNTITPYGTVDSSQSIVRIESFLRGPNPLGSYLVIVAALVAGLWKRSRRVILSIFFIALLIVLYKTYSRSAAIGLLVTAVVFTWLSMTNKQLRNRLFCIGSICVAVAVVVVVLLLPHSTFLQNDLLHTKTHDKNASSNVVHLSALENTLSAIIHKPFGHGPGTYGPASFYSSTPRIPEDYYLDVAAEYGILGLLIFVIINIWIAKDLWGQRYSWWPRMLFATLCGISVINLMLQGWSDDTTGLMWWGLAGLFTFSRTEVIRRNDN